MTRFVETVQLKEELKKSEQDLFKGMLSFRDLALAALATSEMVQTKGHWKTLH